MIISVMPRYVAIIVQFVRYKFPPRTRPFKSIVFLGMKLVFVLLLFLIYNYPFVARVKKNSRLKSAQNFNIYFLDYKNCKK